MFFSCSIRILVSTKFFTLLYSQLLVLMPRIGMSSKIF